MDSFSRLSKKFSFWAVLSVICSLTIVISFVEWNSPKRQTELGFFIAEEVINGQLEQAQRGYPVPDNSLVVQLERGIFNTFYLEDLGSYRILSAWVYGDGTLNALDRGAVEEVAKNREIFIFVFAIREMKKNEAVIDVLTLYPWDEIFSSAGGFGAHWLLNRTDSEWQVTEKIIDFFED